ncbi:MAG: CPBP family intramembrane metalloprotease [Cyclobacteriaceae bacterium]|nr:CPBP family intramembrane metalloprotease [Cyclobacteriaceae bacterium]
MNHLGIDASALATVWVVFITSIILLLLYLLVSGEVKISRKSWFNESLHQVLWQRFSGFLILGILPAFLVIYYFNHSLESVGYRASNLTLTFGYSAGLGLLILFISRQNAWKKREKSLYPQIKVARWTPALIVLNAFTWALYLLGYEFFFRGFMLYLMAEYWPVWLSILVNTVLYSLAHLHKNLQEVLGAIPFGIVLCLITLQTGNFFTAFILHCLLAISTDAFSIYFQGLYKVGTRT